MPPRKVSQEPKPARGLAASQAADETTNYIGVTWMPRQKKFESAIQPRRRGDNIELAWLGVRANGKPRKLNAGYFDSPSQAAHASDK